MLTYNKPYQQKRAHETFVILGEFNARVGSLNNERSRGDDDGWEDEEEEHKVLRPHGYGELNEAGKELLSFLSINEATVCSTWFQKKGIHKATCTATFRFKEVALH